jgi:hypothetical protein
VLYWISVIMNMYMCYIEFPLWWTKSARFFLASRIHTHIILHNAHTHNTQLHTSSAFHPLHPPHFLLFFFSSSSALIAHKNILYATVYQVKLSKEPCTPPHYKYYLKVSVNKYVFTSNVPSFAQRGPHSLPQPWPWTLTLTTGSLLFPLSLKKVWSKSMTLFFVYFNS